MARNVGMGLTEGLLRLLELEEQRNYREKLLEQKGKPDLGQMLLEVIGGVKPVTDVFTPKQIASKVPPTVAQAEGGQVMAPIGSTFQEGQILSPAGERIGEYLPGYEPQVIPQNLTEMLGRQFGGVTPEQARIGLLPASVRSMMPSAQREKPSKYEYNAEITNRVISKIRTEEDIKELLKNRTAYKEAGVDVGEVLKTYLENPIKKNPGLLQRIRSFLGG